MVDKAGKQIHVKSLDLERKWVPKRVTAYLKKNGISITHMKNGQNVLTGERAQLETIARGSGSKIFYLTSRDLWRVRLPLGFIFSI
jgi:hypothetical protein